MNVMDKLNKLSPYLDKASRVLLYVYIALCLFIVAFGFYAFYIGLGRVGLQVVLAGALALAAGLIGYKLARSLGDSLARLLIARRHT